ncbi:hypothetical protein OG985_19315 [Streptomyces sp. NBC_00289]|uniref:hypothetical protein n=1 Tax=Streptomyces sp. NBC_00289 TaxID=2975703 RepID=UPI003243D9A7
MLRHEFQPGKLVAGAFLTLAGVIYAGDAGGLWETPWFAVIPIVVGGLCLAGAVGFLAGGIRRRRAGRAGRAGGPGGPAEVRQDTGG